MAKLIIINRGELTGWKGLISGILELISAIITIFTFGHIRFFGQYEWLMYNLLRLKKVIN